MDKLTAAKTLVQDEQATASACYYALNLLLGSTWKAWEPESIWLELDAQGMDIPVINREKIMAVRSLFTTGRFWFDAQAFEKTVISFNHEHNTHVGVEDPPVPFINWAVFEADLLHKEVENMTLELDREPINYTAIQLHREGYLVAPEMLSWAEPYLNKLNCKGNEELRDKIRHLWAAVPMADDLTSVEFTETPIGVQLARQAMVRVHFNKMIESRRKQLARIRT